jgi:Ca-activated chloride channel family protein
MQKRFILSVTVVACLAIGEVFAKSPEAAAKVRTGNTAYAEGDYAAALAAYDEAEVTCPECPEIAYNRGLAYYQMRDFVKARDMFNVALQTRDLDLEARAKYNLGNVSYAQALEKLNAPSEAIELARVAIDHYRDALDLDPDDADARGNIEIAQLFIKDMLDKLEQEQEQQQDQQSCDNPQEQQDGEQKQEQDQQSQQSEQDQEQQEQEQAGEQADEQEQEEQQSQEQSEQQELEEQERQVAQSELREMSEEEVERILQAVRDREAQRRTEQARRLNVGRAPVSRDW